MWVKRKARGALTAPRAFSQVSVVSERKRGRDLDRVVMLQVMDAISHGSGLEDTCAAGAPDAGRAKKAGAERVSIRAMLRV
jgi:hypothetical protein